MREKFHECSKDSQTNEYENFYHMTSAFFLKTLNTSLSDLDNFHQLTSITFMFHYEIKVEWRIFACMGCKKYGNLNENWILM